MKCGDRDRLLRWTHRAQLVGAILGWDLDESTGKATVFVPEDESCESIPARFGTITVVVVPLPRPEEHAWTPTVS